MTEPDFLTKETIDELKRGAPTPPKPMYDCVTRVIDVLASGIGLLMASPLTLVIAAAIKIQDGGPVLYRQERLGKDGVPFLMLKFRTMIVGAESIGSKLRVASADRRITRLGRILREFHLDEVPQLINVLRGEMTLVGPRPTILFHKDYYEDWEMARLTVHPGMTGLPQVSGGNSLTWDDRIAIDVYFVKHRSALMYLRILFATFRQLWSKKGVYAKDGSVEGWTRPSPDWYKDSVPSNQESSASGG